MSKSEIPASAETDERIIILPEAPEVDGSPRAKPRKRNKPLLLAVASVTALAVVAVGLVLAGAAPGNNPRQAAVEGLTTAEATQFALLSASWDSLDDDGRQVLCQLYGESPQHTWEDYDKQVPGQVAQQVFLEFLDGKCG